MFYHDVIVCNVMDIPTFPIQIMLSLASVNIVWKVYTKAASNKSAQLQLCCNITFQQETYVKVVMNHCRGKLLHQLKPRGCFVLKDF